MPVHQLSQNVVKGQPSRGGGENLPQDGILSGRSLHRGDNLSPPLSFPLKRRRDGTTGSARMILPCLILPVRPALLSIPQVFVAVLLCLAGKAGIRGRECWRLWEG